VPGRASSLGSSYQKALLGVEHAQAKGHVVDRRIELEVEPLGLCLPLHQLDRLGLEHGNGPRQPANLVLAREPRDVDGSVVAGKSDQRVTDSL
jgi:hypothetical protein